MTNENKSILDNVLNHIKEKKELIVPLEDIEKLDLVDIIDVKEIQSILDDFNKITHITCAILDIQGNIIAGAGWQDICVKYHRAHPESSLNCKKSDTILTKNIPAGEFRMYKCKNHMWDIATPLIVNEKRMGNIFVGQFFFDDDVIDYDLFIRQAKQYHFEENDYMSLLEKVPRLSHDVVNAIMSVFAKFAQMLSLSSFRNMQLARVLIEYDTLMELLEKSDAKHKGMIANIADVITIINKNGIADYVSPNIEKLFGWRPQDILGSSAWSRIHPEDLSRIQMEFSDLLNKAGSAKTVEFKYLCKDGTYKEIELTAANLENDRNINGILMNYHDITERKQREREIQFLTYHDTLTGLYNRAFYEAEIKRLNCERQLPLSVIIGDINGLKLINDAFGHAEGDRCLISIAGILQSCCREYDIVSRIGGDEFSILLPGTTNKTAKSICERIKVACEELSKTEKTNYYTSISLGYATKNIDSESIEKIMLTAEELMYKRKLLEQKSLHSSILAYIRSTMIEKSIETAEHEERLIRSSRALGQALRLNDTRMNELELLAALHDIGKIGIDRRILNKPGRLTDKEWFEMKKHCEIGYRIAMASEELKPIADYILCHHERWDGSGYPQGLAGKSIPLLSRIISVADAYDAMTEDRPYRKAMKKEAAINEIKNHAGSQFDPDIAKVFIEKVLKDIGR